MITLYELHWSHYCEKIRWALDYKKLPWKKVNINAFTKEEMKAFPCQQERYLVPFIHDQKNNIALGESTAILEYLEQAYPDSPALFPKNPLEKAAMQQWLIELDSKLGVIGRKLGYAQLILEVPTILPTLFLSKIKKGIFNFPVIRRFSTILLGMILIKRFQLELNEPLNLYQELEAFLLPIAQKMQQQKYWVGSTFSAADLTLAVYLRPLLIIPFFREHPKLASLFQWQQEILQQHQREPKLLYEVVIEASRKTKAPVRRKLNNNHQQSGFLSQVSQVIEKNKTVFNDHKPIWTWRMWVVPYYYFFKIKKNKVRQEVATDWVR